MTVPFTRRCAIRENGIEVSVARHCSISRMESFAVSSEETQNEVTLVTQQKLLRHPLNTGYEGAYGRVTQETQENGNFIVAGAQSQKSPGCVFARVS